MKFGKEEDALNTHLNRTIERVKQSFNLARKQKPVYAEIYPFLEPLFLAQIKAKDRIRLEPVQFTDQIVKTKWEEGFSLLYRWDFPLDTATAEDILSLMKEYIPTDNEPLQNAHAIVSEGLTRHSAQKERYWQSFLQLEWEPWAQWITLSETDAASVLVWARNVLRPSIEWTAESLLSQFPLPDTWRMGYCPICGSLPSLLFLEDEGERKGYCSWCGTIWKLNRFQCPHCDNRYHQSLGYFYAEFEPHYRIQYCRVCRMYFKTIDTREFIDPPYFPLEEWATLHLDLLAQRAGWTQPPSPSPTVYGKSDE